MNQKRNMKRPVIQKNKNIQQKTNFNLSNIAQNKTKFNCRIFCLISKKKNNKCKKLIKQKNLITIFSLYEE